ncbi:MAG: ABC transporter ATP-binding protein [Gammaproteobacteria bacterium]|nr:ABC transporter ATP-binding protein [Gammaproteobacteria bacterium]
MAADARGAIVLSARSLSRDYPQGSERLAVLRGIDLDLAAGERVAVLGASGSGKSTLLHLLAGLDRPSAGHVTLAGVRLDELDVTGRVKLRNRSLGFVYQFHHLLMEFSALENVALPLVIAGVRQRRARREAERLLERVGLSRRRHARPAKLSGGERQRVAIARALATRPPVVLADEPTGNLDEETGAEVYALMLEINREFGTAFLIATHDAVIARGAGRVLRLDHGRLGPSPRDSA